MQQSNNKDYGNAENAENVHIFQGANTNTTSLLKYNKPTEKLKHAVRLMIK
jgi:hypothetical protein